MNWGRETTAGTGLTDHVFFCVCAGTVLALFSSIFDVDVRPLVGSKEGGGLFESTRNAEPEIGMEVVRL